MVLDLYNSHRETRDNLGNQDENKNLILLGPYKETIGTELGPTQITISNIGDAFILGHVTNGILGTSMLGATNYGSPTVVRVVNPNNIFHEHFRFSDFNDTTVTTASFSTTYFNVSFDLDEIFQTKSIFYNVESVQYVTIYVNLTGSKTTITVDNGGGQLVTLTEGT